MEEARLWSMSSDELYVAWVEARVNGDKGLEDKILLNMGDACIEEGDMHINDVGYVGDTSGAGRGKHLKVDIALCRVDNVKEEYENFPKQRSKLNNQKAQKKITEEEWKIEVDKILKRRDVVMTLIENDVRARVFDETGRTLEQELKRRKTDNKKLETIQKLTKEVLASGQEGEKQVDAAKVLHDAMQASSSDMFGSEATKTTQELKKTAADEKKKEAADKRQKKLDEEKEKDPEKFAQKQKDAAAQRESAKAAAAAKKAADPKTIERKEKQQVAAEKAAEAAAKKATETAEKARDPVAYAAKKAEKAAAEQVAAAEKAAEQQAAKQEEEEAKAEKEKEEQDVVNALDDDDDDDEAMPGVADAAEAAEEEAKKATAHVEPSDDDKDEAMPTDIPQITKRMRHR